MAFSKGRGPVIGDRKRHLGACKSGFKGASRAPSELYEHGMNRPFGQRSRSPGYN